MTSSTSSSSRVRASSPRGGRARRRVRRAPPAPSPEAASRPRLKVLVLPPENLVGGPVPAREVTARLEQMVALAGADVIGGDRLDEYLARYRIRYTGGVDACASRAARDDLGADAILVTSVILWSAPLPWPRSSCGSSRRADVPSVLWMDGSPAPGDDSPGLFGLGLVTDSAGSRPRRSGRWAPRSSATSPAEAPRPAAPAGAGCGRALPTGPARTSGPGRERRGAPLREPDPPPGSRRDGGARVRPPVRAADGFRVVEPGVVRRSCSGGASSWRTGSRSTRPGWSRDARRRPRRGRVRLRLRGRRVEPQRRTSPSWSSTARRDGSSGNRPPTTRGTTRRPSSGCARSAPPRCSPAGWPAR